MFDSADFSDLPAFACAHATDAAAGTGCTVFVAPTGATCGVDVRGGGPATRETDLLRPENMVEQVHAVVLSGGSAFGLAAATGVMDALAAQNIGFAIGPARVPIVPAACLFDLLVGQNKAPTAQMGATACREALAIHKKNNEKGGEGGEGGEGEANPEMGNVGAGCGATVGKLGRPEAAMKSGFGWSGVRAGDLVVLAAVAVNAVGNVYDFDGRPLAGSRTQDGQIADANELVVNAWQSALQNRATDRTGFHEGQRVVTGIQNGSGSKSVHSEHADVREDAGLHEESAREARVFSGTGIEPSPSPSANTTLGVVLTNACLSKAQATKVSQIAQDAYARRISPVHTLGDGDAIFTLCAGEIQAPTDVVGVLATAAMEQAIVHAVCRTQAAYGLPCAKDLSCKHKQ